MANEDIGLSIKTLKEYTSGMIVRCKEAVSLSVDSMVSKNLEQAKKVVESDDDIDLLREYIRDRSVELMASKHPMTKDLRYIYVLSDISTELERIGDYAVNICKETIAIGNDEHIKELIDIPKMSEMCTQMLEDLMVAFLEEDDEMAYQIALKDKELDELYYRIRKDSLRVMHKDPQNNINQGVRLLFVGRYLERIGDHITNICEKIIYAKKGTMVEIG
ncbi:phosphate signaling complex protein PhoU [Intestinibacter sp.]|uniref:phosphate signaling complex protein PhoU n=1 Tax=Intestinibacter sp. TaxID=1965304 RepID=UPI002A754E2F|nr:phosphate signaling complex protein PhoU [Intestinibacter sp.]MDY2735475.1 phosphate signaling complex protein PhoU [Intestinibacter sp.]MDY4574716.1 phosphate signaling complex protein PhoU [Intestinibacter sp.]